MPSTASSLDRRYNSNEYLEARSKEITSQLQARRAQLIREENPLQVCQIQENIGDLQYELDDIGLLLANEPARRQLKIDHLAAKAFLQARNQDSLLSSLQSQNKALRDEVNSLKEGHRTSKPAQQSPQRPSTSDLIKNKGDHEIMDLTTLQRARAASTSPGIQSNTHLAASRDIPPLPQSIFRSSSPPTPGTPLISPMQISPNVSRGQYIKFYKPNTPTKRPKPSKPGTVDCSKRRRVSAHVDNETTESVGVSKSEQDKDCHKCTCGFPIEENENSVCDHCRGKRHSFCLGPSLFHGHPAGTRLCRPCSSLFKKIKKDGRLSAFHRKITPRRCDTVAYSLDVIEVDRSVSPELGHHKDSSA
ncbi:hypothetical protein F5Y18DRAFT_13216 [Xylariaceae sp. FL1019]|nr:hypothetical protein F5Y18DRAFT_13216 [Xylariaceae sp. FL1019]